MVISFNSRLCIANNNEESEMFKLPIWLLIEPYTLHYTSNTRYTLQLQGLQVFYQAWFLSGQDGMTRYFLTESFIGPAALERPEDNEWTILICCIIVLIAKYTEYHLPTHIPYLEHTQGRPVLPAYHIMATRQGQHSQHRRTKITLFDKYKYYEIYRLEQTQGRYTASLPHGSREFLFEISKVWVVQ